MAPLAPLAPLASLVPIAPRAERAYTGRAMKILGKGAPDARKDLFGGTGTVKVWNLLRRGAPPFTAALACELDPGGRVGRHRQQEFPEIVVGIEGLGEAVVGKQQHALRPGDVVYLPLGETLELINHSETEPLHYLIIKAALPGPEAG